MEFPVVRPVVQVDVVEVSLCPKVPEDFPVMSPSLL